VIDPVLQSPDNSKSMDEITFKKADNHYKNHYDEDNPSEEVKKNRSMSDNYERISMSGTSDKENAPDIHLDNVEEIRRPVSCEISCQTDEFKGSPQTSSNYDHPIHTAENIIHKKHEDTACKELKKRNKQHSIAEESDISLTEDMKISFMNFSIGDIALFVPIDDKRQHWMAFHSNRPYRFLAQVHSLLFSSVSFLFLFSFFSLAFY
jgi:hypothetical protein